MTELLQAERWGRRAPSRSERSVAPPAPFSLFMCTLCARECIYVSLLCPCGPLRPFFLLFSFPCCGRRRGACPPPRPYLKPLLFPVPTSQVLSLQHPFLL